MSDNRDRLIELFKGAESKVIEELDKHLELDEEEWMGIYADYLLANSVIVPPCKVGQQLWFVENGKVKCSTVDRLVYEELSTDDIFTRIEGYGFSVLFEDIGKIVFLTREETEKALERSKGNA